MKTRLALFLLLGVGIIAGSFYWAAWEPRPRAGRKVVRLRTSQPEAHPTESVPIPVRVEQESAPASEPLTPPPVAAPVTAPVKKSATPVIPPAPEPAAPAPGVPRTKEPPQNPLARAALSLVGSDSEAEELWLAAINDPDLPANERKDLIEDLNEDGFPSPRQLTADDLPLILSRIALIERLAPDALDEVNAEAFLEAYKDLWNMYERLVGQ